MFSKPQEIQMFSDGKDMYILLDGMYMHILEPLLTSFSNTHETNCIDVTSLDSYPLHALERGLTSVTVSLEFQIIKPITVVSGEDLNRQDLKFIRNMTINELFKTIDGKIKERT